MSEPLWWTANVLVSILTIAIAYYDGPVSAILAWGILTIILMAIRPNG